MSVRAFNSAGAGPATAPVNTLTQENGKIQSNSPLFRKEMIGKIGKMMTGKRCSQIIHFYQESQRLLNK